MFLSRLPLRTIAAAFLGMWLCLAVQAQQPAPAEEKPDEAKTGSITGSVVNDTGQPLAGAGVFANAIGAPAQGRTTTTDSEGNFQLNGLDPALYMIFARVPGYVPMSRESEDPQKQPNYYRVGDSLRLIQMKGAVITGTVTNSQGEPVVKVVVRATLIRDASGQPAKFGRSNERETDDRGIYRIYGLMPGTYVVSAGGGNRFGFYNIDAYDADAPTYAPSSTRDTAAEITVRSGDETAGVDIRYRGEPGRVVSGIANGPTASGPYSYYTVTLTSRTSNGLQSSNSAFQPAGTRGFSFSGIVDGDYELTAQSSSVGEFTLSEPVRIKVKGADVNGIELTTRPLAAITGQVTLAPSKAPECKGKRRPVFAETLITATLNQKDPANTGDFMSFMGTQAVPDKEGSFTLRNARSGQYAFGSHFFAKYWYLQSISLPSAAKGAGPVQSIDAAKNWTTVKLGDRISNLNITFAEGAASLRGQVSVPEGQKLPAKLLVYLIPAERDKAEDALRFFVSAVTSNGDFAVGNVAPGHYWLLAQATSDDIPATEAKLRLPDAATPRTKLRRDSETLKTELELKPCQNVADYKLLFSLTPSPKDSPAAP